ncbi:MAG: methyl-accepting chemotaxis protein [Spirochaetales bacterium]|nr:methyl-accepting chemotaxis protein [Spirochaetales bacterium]
MKQKISLGTKLIFIFALVFIVSISTVTIINNMIARESLKTRLFESEIPAIIETVTDQVDEKIMKTVSGVAVAADDPFLRQWILEGEPSEILPMIQERMKTISDRFNTMGSSFVIWDSGSYYEYVSGEYNYRVVNETDTWFPAFKESGVDSNINAYLNDQFLGEVAFINVRIDYNGRFLGLASISLSLTDFVDTIVHKTIGDEGNTFMIDRSGLVQLHKTKEMIGTLNVGDYPEYGERLNSIFKNDSFAFEYRNEQGDIIYVNSRFIPELDWFLITEASESELFSQMNAAIAGSVVAAVFLIILGGLAFYIMIKRSIKPLKELESLTYSVASGRLGATVSIRTSDEIGVLTEAVNEMSLKLSEIVGEVMNTAAHVSSGSRQLSASSEQIATGANQQAAAVEELSASIEEMKANIDQNADTTVKTEKIAMKARKNAEESSKVIDETIQATNQITQKITIIDEIARQTNLLALNAAIEAARAGEAGKGFAVVAQEVRKLAERSQEAASEILELSSSTSEVSKKAVEMLAVMLPEIEETAELIQEINAATGEQAIGADQINTAISRLDEVVSLNASSSEELASTAQSFDEQVNKLNNSMSFFDLEGK